jgi:glutaredoxin|tara:strand:- start:146 stop:454 length:309 start_codon:yes stop_codon:yes gene_type:complete
MFYIIGTGECEYCAMAKDFLFEKGLPYIFYTPTEEEELNELKRHWVHRTVPIILFITPYGIEYVGGFDDLSEGFDRLQATYGLLDESSDVRGGDPRRDLAGR